MTARFKAGRQLEENLEELQRICNIESLRHYIAKEHCFLQNVNTETAPITSEELKRLARAWKLDHEQRNFWKNHSNTELLVAALIQHINEKGKGFLRESKRNKVALLTDRSSHENTRFSIPNYFSQKNIEGISSPQELIMKSRIPLNNTSNEFSVNKLIDKWRWEDFNG